MVFRIDGFASHVADFLRVFCVSADAAAAFASLLAVLLRSTFAAVAATFALVVSLLPFCVRADAATDFSSFDAILLLRTLAAAEATLELVLSDLAALAMGDHTVLLPQLYPDRPLVFRVLASWRVVTAA